MICEAPEQELVVLSASCLPSCLRLEGPPLKSLGFLFQGPLTFHPSTYPVTIDVTIEAASTSNRHLAPISTACRASPHTRYLSVLTKVALPSKPNPVICICPSNPAPYRDLSTQLHQKTFSTVMHWAHLPNWGQPVAKAPLLTSVGPEASHFHLPTPILGGTIRSLRPSWH